MVNVGPPGLDEAAALELKRPDCFQLSFLGADACLESGWCRHVDLYDLPASQLGILAPNCSFGLRGLCVDSFDGSLFESSWANASLSPILFVTIAIVCIHVLSNVVAPCAADWIVRTYCRPKSDGSGAQDSRNLLVSQLERYVLEALVTSALFTAFARNIGFSIFFTEGLLDAGHTNALSVSDVRHILSTYTWINVFLCVSYAHQLWKWGSERGKMRSSLIFHHCVSIVSGGLIVFFDLYKDEYIAKIALVFPLFAILEPNVFVQLMLYRVLCNCSSAIRHQVK
jgi:hypothetical protein